MHNFKKFNEVIKLAHSQTNMATNILYRKDTTSQCAKVQEKEMEHAVLNNDH